VAKLLAVGKINLRDNRVTQYFRETWFELKKVSWPTRSEGLNLTLMVIVVTAFLSIILALMDYVFSTGFTQLVKLIG
jgi:preprotein translocase subunit SecE